jgi:hypothetical protein
MVDLYTVIIKSKSGIETEVTCKNEYENIGMFLLYLSNVISDLDKHLVLKTSIEGVFLFKSEDIHSIQIKKFVPVNN